MENIGNELRLLIKGNHYYATPFVFSNVYGRAIFKHNDFAENTPASMYEDIASELFEDDYYEYARTERLSTQNSTLLPIFRKINHELLSHTEHEKIVLPISEEDNEVELYTDGVIAEDNGLKIIYGDRNFPICLHVGNDGIVTLDSENDAVPMLTFEKGKRHFVNLSPLVKLGLPDGKTEIPLQICIFTHDIRNELIGKSKTLEISYSIEIAGSQAEKTNFSVTVLG